MFRYFLKIVLFKTFHISKIFKNIFLLTTKNVKMLKKILQTGGNVEWIVWKKNHCTIARYRTVLVA